MQHTQLQEDIKVVELLRLLIVAEGVRQVGCLRIVLAAGILVEILTTTTRYMC